MRRPDGLLPRIPRPSLRKAPSPGRLRVNHASGRLGASVRDRQFRFGMMAGALENLSWPEVKARREPLSPLALC
jgi:hypothetical protein